jgi:hypothetical protein
MSGVHLARDRVETHTNCDSGLPVINGLAALVAKWLLASLFFVVCASTAWAFNLQVKFPVHFQRLSA